jgi:hypothetical protein
MILCCVCDLEVVSKFIILCGLSVKRIKKERVHSMHIIAFDGFLSAKWGDSIQWNIKCQKGRLSSVKWGDSMEY